MNLLFFSGSCWALKIQGTTGAEMSSNAALITMETYAQQGETI